MRFKYIVIALIAFAAYVSGARAGRERYEQIKNSVLGFWNDPAVKRARDQADKDIKKTKKLAGKKAKRITKKLR